MKLEIKAYIGIVAMFVITLVTPVTGYEIKTITESLSVAEFDSALTWVTYLIFTYIGLNALRYFIALMLFKSLNNSINENRIIITEHAMNLPYSEVERLKSQKLKNICSEDSKNVCKSFVEILQKSSNVFQLVAVLVYILVLDVNMGLTMIGVLLISLISNIIFIKKLRKLNKQRNEVGDARDQYFNSLFLGFQQWFPNGTIPKIGDKLKSLIHKANKLSEKDINMDVTMNSLIDIVHDMGFVICIYIISVGVISGYAEIGTIPLMVSYAGILYSGFYNMAYMSKSFSSYKESKRRLDEVMNKESMKYGDKTLDFDQVPEIELNIESFSYPSAPDREILKDLKLRFVGYGMYALVTISGLGKSTIFRLLTRIFDLVKGYILVNKVKLNDLTSDCLKSYFYTIKQEPYFTDTTIRENFILECGDVSDEEIWDVCKRFKIIVDILNSNNGLDTIIGESGLNLSGGQKQLLTICKMLLKAKHSKVLLLDEATSALDGKHQKQVLSILRELAKDHMIIMINHRLSMNVDSTIYYIDDCHNVHIGRHEELMELDSYRELYNNE